MFYLYSQAHVYRANALTKSMNVTPHVSQIKCSAFLANIDEHRTATVKFLDQSYSLPPWSVTILPDCRNAVFNTAKVWFQFDSIALLFFN